MLLRGLHEVCFRKTTHFRDFVTHQPFPRKPSRRKERRKRMEQKAMADSLPKSNTTNAHNSVLKVNPPESATSVKTKYSTTSSPSSVVKGSTPFRNWIDRARSRVANNTFSNSLNWTPVRYRLPIPRVFQKEHCYALAQRLPFFMVLVGLLTYDETAPFQFIHIHGPSMLPTMAADGSDVWFSLKARWCARNWRRGDIVGFAHPSENPQRISCKRIIGLPGDRVPRYGQYVHLFTQQDPKNWGIAPIPQDSPGSYGWVREDWDQDCTMLDDPMEEPQRNPKRHLTVPEGHVWLEADCPGFGIDSRHFGPIPSDWIRGKVVARVWPLGPLRHKIRPHPIPLDRETLMEHNLFRV